MAAEKSVKVTLTANTTGFRAAMMSAADATTALYKATEKASQSAKFDSAAAGLAKFGVVAAGAGVMAVKAFADFDRSMSEVKATGADAAANIDALRQAALEAGADTKYSATEAAGGVEALLKAGVSAADVMGGGLNGALSLAAAGNQSVADSAETAASAMTQFGLSGKDVPHIADLLAAAAGKAQGEVSDMAAALNQSGLVAAQAGLSIDETTGTLAAFASAGLIGSDAGTSFKTMLQRLTAPTADAQKTMASLGISMYDSQGQFIGMSAAAGQLQRGMQDLDPASRAAAMSVIFGSDAVRAASVLYTQGASGIQSWIDQTNAAGFAQEQASAKMDNLAGDLEQLKGSIETMAITAGSASNGPLRQLVQTLTSLVNWVGGSTAAQGILVMVGALGGLSLAAAGVMKTIQTLSEFRAVMSSIRATVGGISALDGLRSKMDQVATSTEKARVSVGKFAQGAGVGLGVATAAMAINATAAVEALDAARIKSDDFAKSIATGQTDIAAKLTYTEGLFGQYSLSMGESLKRVLDPGKFDSWTDGLNKMVTGASAVDEITKNFKQLDGALTKVDAAKAASTFAQVTKAAQDQSVPLDRLVTLFPQYKAQLEQTAQALGVTALSSQDYVDWMGGKIPPAVQAAAQAQQGAKGSAVDLSHATGGVAASAQKAADATLKQYEAIVKSAQAALQASGSEIGYRSAVDDATAAVAKNGRTLDLTSEAGRANRQALDGVAASMLSFSSAQSEAGASGETLRRNMIQGRAQFIATATAMGMTKAAAAALADQYGLVPGSVKTTVTAPGTTAAQGQVRTLDSLIRGLPPKKAVKVRTAYEQQGYDAAKAAYDRLTNKMVTVTTVYRGTGTPWAAVGIGGRGTSVARAGGGLVRGPGTGTSDSIPAMLSDHEFVVRAAVTRSNLAALDHLNRTGQWPARFAQGGLVQTGAPQASVAAMTSRLAQVVANSGATTVNQTNNISAEDPQLAAAYIGRRMAAIL